jgi:hypothetical protein
LINEWLKRGVTRHNGVAKVEQGHGTLHIAYDNLIAGIVWVWEKGEPGI